MRPLCIKCLHNCHISLTATLITRALQQTTYTLILTVTVLALPSTGTILTIKPSSNTPCLNNLCLTLSEYAQNQPQYFSSSNITLQFLPGNHTLASNLIIANIQHLDILGDTTSLTSSRIKCSDSNVGFEFRNISKVRVRDMTFTYCGISRSIYQIYRSSTGTRLQSGIVEQYYALLFLSVQHVEIGECVFNHNFGTALGIVNSSATLSGNNMFSSNCRCSNVQKCHQGCFGGGIYVETSDVNFDGNTTFDGNPGGGMYAQFNNFVSFSGSTTFKGNIAVNGGGIHALYNSNVSFSGSTTFKGNIAMNGGGVFASHNSHVKFSGTGTISDNVATNGGGIYLEGSSIEVSGNITVRNNRAYLGGGIYLARFHDRIFMRSNKRFSHFSGTSTISDNTAERGGGIFSVRNNININGRTIVRNNTALQHGGGIILIGSNIDISGNITV